MMSSMKCPFMVFCTVAPTFLVLTSMTFVWAFATKAEAKAKAHVKSLNFILFIVIQLVRVAKIVKIFVICKFFERKDVIL